MIQITERESVESIYNEYKANKDHVFSFYHRKKKQTKTTTTTTNELTTKNESTGRGRVGKVSFPPRRLCSQPICLPKNKIEQTSLVVWYRFFLRSGTLASQGRRKKHDRPQSDTTTNIMTTECKLGSSAAAERNRWFSNEKNSDRVTTEWKM